MDHAEEKHRQIKLLSSEDFEVRRSAVASLCRNLYFGRDFLAEVFMTIAMKDDSEYLRSEGSGCLGVLFKRTGHSMVSQFLAEIVRNTGLAKQERSMAYVAMCRIHESSKFVGQDLDSKIDDVKEKVQRYRFYRDLDFDHDIDWEFVSSCSFD